MELGNMAFGHSRGEHLIQRGIGFEEELMRLFDAAFPNVYEWGRSYGHEFNNSTWECHPYCWCDNEDCPQCGTGEQPNFRHHPTGFEIQWYKYPFRDSYASAPITIGQFSKIIDDCINSLKP